MLTILWLLSLFLPASCAQLLVTCAYKGLCQQALLSGNDVVLQCDHLQAYWYFSSFQGEDLFLVSSLQDNIIAREQGLLAETLIGTGD